MSPPRRKSRRRASDRTLEQKANKPAKPEQEDDENPELHSDKFLADVDGWVFDDPAFQASLDKNKQPEK